MSEASDCSALASAFNIELGSDCCTSSGAFAQCGSDNRINVVEALCTSGGQSWFGGTFPQGLEALTSLTILFLDDCNMTGPVPDIWSSFPDLFELHFASNVESFTGPNSNVGNRFEGYLPTSLGTLTNLNFLHAQNNRFIGDVPSGLSAYVDAKVCQSANPCYFQLEGNCLTNVPAGNSAGNAYVYGSETTGCPTTWSTASSGSAANSPSATLASSVAVEGTGSSDINTSSAAGAVGGGSSSSSTAKTSSVGIAKSSSTTTTSTVANSDSTAATNSNSSGSNSTVMIAGIAGGVVLLIVLGFAIWCRSRTRTRKGKINEDLSNEIYVQNAGRTGGYELDQRGGAGGQDYHATKQAPARAAQQNYGNNNPNYGQNGGYSGQNGGYVSPNAGYSSPNDSYSSGYTGQNGGNTRGGNNTQNGYKTRQADQRY
ncbi:hypothetical protein HK100_003394 [Physocladia obscura]|uniref:L domain-like protein n=1 Tax=Physocladia obscura TaxID=109957 RepID=A0AAD5SWY9_9FUNG|nr:hypothetical protein HK100_003394 [Physocladia obscura]